jgi:hypothetical protein
MSVVQETCDELFSLFKAVVPLSSRKHKDLPTPKVIEAGLNRFYAEARALRARLRLGVISRARVAFHLQQRLLAEGYPQDLVRQVLFSLLVSAFSGR